MSSKAHTSKKRSQQLKRNPKRKTSGEEVELSKKEVMKIPSSSSRTLFFLRFLKFIYLFILEREEGEREGEKHQCVCVGCLWHAPNQGPGPQPRHAPQL